MWSLGHCGWLLFTNHKYRKYTVYTAYKVPYVCVCCIGIHPIFHISIFNNYFYTSTTAQQYSSAPVHYSITEGLNNMFTTRGMRSLLGYNMYYRVNRQFHRANIRSIEQTINVPLLGESITEGSIAKWNMQVGDKVKVDDIVVSIETDKITVDVRCPYNGVITKHYGEPADSVRSEYAGNFYIR